MRLDVYISAPDYLEERKSCFTEVTEEYKEESNRDKVKEEPINLEEETIKKGAQRKKKKNVRTASFVVVRLSRRLPVSRLSAPPSPFASGVYVPGSSAPPPGSSAPLSPSASDIHVPGLSVPLPRLSTPPSLFASGVRVPGSSALFASGASMLRSSAPPPGSSTPPSPFISGVHVLGSSALPPRLSAPLSPSASSVCVPGSSVPFPSGRLLVPGLSLHGSSLPFPL